MTRAGMREWVGKAMNDIERRTSMQILISIDDDQLIMNVSCPYRTPDDERIMS